MDNRLLFDCMFTNAGDDVDFSWRLRDAEMTLAYAPGAVVFHQPRTTISAYLKQQSGYGHAEGLLFRKYPNRHDRVYGESRWFAQWFGAGSRIYYGAFGRGLFQTIYPRSELPLAAQVPLTFQWVAVAVLLALAGIFDKAFGILGIAGLLVTLACAVAGGAGSGGKLQGFAGRMVLIGLWMSGPLLRSWERERVKWSFSPDASGGIAFAAARLSGTIPLTGLSSQSVQAAAVPPTNLDEMIEVLYLALIRRGLAVAKGGSYDSFDLQIIVPPYIRVAVLLMRNGNTLSLAWRTGAAGWRIAASLAALLILLLVGGFSLPAAIAICGLASGAVAFLALRRAWRVPGVIYAASAELVAPSEISSQAGTERSPATALLGKTAG
jgi:hypothetical protein